MERQLLEGQEDARGPTAPLFGPSLDLGTIDGNDAELAGDEESVSDDEKQNGAEAQNGFYVSSLSLFTGLPE